MSTFTRAGALVALAAAAALSLTGCGSDEPATPEGSATTSATSQPAPTGKDGKTKAPASLTVGVVTKIEKTTCTDKSETRVELNKQCLTLDPALVRINNIRGLADDTKVKGSKIILLDGENATAYKDLANRNVGRELAVVVSGNAVTRIPVRGQMSDPVVVPVGKISAQAVKDIGTFVGRYEKK